MMFHVKPSRSHESSLNPVSWSSIRDDLASIGISAASGACVLLARHAELVIEANRSFNLTRIAEPADVARLHILDSATAVSAVLDAPAGSIADLGSGAGYPGMVVAILTERPTVLVESVKKKATFLGSCVAELGVDVSVYADRAEVLAGVRKQQFTCVTARALAPLPSLVELGAPLLMRGGRLIAMKARPNEEELQSGRRAAQICGMEEVERLPVSLSSSEERILVIYDRVGPAKLQLPRRVGLAQRSPLA